MLITENNIMNVNKNKLGSVICCIFFLKMAICIGPAMDAAILVNLESRTKQFMPVQTSFHHENVQFDHEKIYARENIKYFAYFLPDRLQI